MTSVITNGFWDLKTLSTKRIQNQCKNMVRLLFFVISSLCLLQSSLGVVDNQSNGDDNKHSIRFRRSRSVMPPDAERTRAVTLPPIPAPIATPVQGPSVSYSLFKWFMKFFINKTYAKQVSAAKPCNDGNYPGQGRNRQDCQALCRSNEPGCFFVNFHHCAAIAKKCQTSCSGKYLNACVEHTTVSKQVVAATCAQYCN